MHRKYLVVLFLTLFCCKQVHAQKYFGITGETFGVSKIQKKRFDWKTIKTSNFEFNFYRGGEEIARRAALKAETEYDKITDILGYTPFSVMKIFIYNSEDDLSQSNIGFNDPVELGSKNINISKARIQLAYNKVDSVFNQNLIKEVTTLFVYDMLYGGSLKESMQSQLLLTLPDWFIKGIARYIAYGSAGVDKPIISALINKHNSKKISNVMGADAEILGYSIWHFIAQRYGKDNISNILNLTRIIRNEQSSITSTLGLSFTKFVKEWKSYYQNGAVETPKPVEIVETLKVDTMRVSSIKDLLPHEIDTKNYVFDPENVRQFQFNENIAKNREEVSLPNQSEVYGKKNKGEIKIGPTKAYNNLLVSKGNVLSIGFDPVRRLGLKYAISFNDLLENNVFKINTFIKPSSPLFKSFDYNIFYGSYKKKIDFQFKFDKRSYNIDGIDESNNFLFRPLNILPLDNKPVLLSRRVYSERLSVDVIYPFTKNLKLEFTPSVVKTVDIEYELPGRASLKDNYLSPQASLVFDNSKMFSNFIDLGSKAKLSLERNVHLGNDLKNFKRLNIDIRHGQKVSNGLILEGRFNYSKSAGNAPKYAILGGVENWVNRSVYEAKGLLPGKAGDFADILFYNFPGQLRGFEFARIFGNSHLLLNLEAKLVMSEYIPTSSLSSSFLRNLEFAAFYDTGTAWKGSKGPFSKQNSLNTIVIGNDGISPFIAEVTDFKSPFLQGFGVGVRTALMGTLLKVDYAVGHENKQYNKPILYISLGRDF
jgi:hypothetical protein